MEPNLQIYAHSAREACGFIYQINFGTRANHMSHRFHRSADHGRNAYDQLLRLWLYLQNKLRHTASPLRGFAACVFPAVAAAVAVSSLPGLFKPGNCAKLRLFTLQWEP